MKNLTLDNPVDEHLKPVKDLDGTSTAIELSTDKIRVKDLEVTGTTTGIQTGTSITVDSSLTDGSTNPVENNAVYDGLATKLNLSGGTMTGNVDFGDNDITNVDSLDADKLSIAGGTEMTGFVDADDMSTGASATTISSSESIKAYVDNNSHIKVANVTLSAYNMNELHNTAITIVAAQGANKVIIPTSGMLFIDRDSSTAQSSSTADLFVGYNGTSSMSETIYYIRRFMYNEGGDRIFHLQHYTGEAGDSLTDGDNVPLTAKLDSAVTLGSIDSMKITVSYYVFDNS